MTTNIRTSPAMQDFIESRAEITRLGRVYERTVKRNPKSCVIKTMEKRLRDLHCRVSDLRDQLIQEQYS